MKNKKLYIIAISIIVFIFIIGTVFYHYSEGITWFNALYLTVMTLLTVGYGDISPKSELARIFTVIFVIVSIPTILFLLGYVIEDFLKHRMQIIENKVNKTLAKEDEIIKEEKEEIKLLKQEKELLEKKNK